MKLFDLHCDTAYEMLRQNKFLKENDLHISLERASELDSYFQVMAVWGDNTLTDKECFEDFLKIAENLKSQTDILGSGSQNKNGFYLSVEDARLLEGKLERLDTLYEAGVRFLIPMWSGSSIIGGAYDTENGLTDFGKNVIKRCFELNIIPDISHSSIESAEDIMNLAEKYGKPVIASHSCSYSVHEHPRNLRDEQFNRIKELGGVVGLSFCRYHLAPENENCTSENILKHLDRYLSLEGEDILCLGADMDGAPLPYDIEGIQSIPMLYEKIKASFGENIAEKITFFNAYNFVNKNLK